MKPIITILLTLSIIGPLYAQDSIRLSSSQNYMYGIIEDNDTIYLSNIEELTIFPKLTFENKRDYKKYQRLIRNVKKAYPYAVIAGEKYRYMEKKLLSLESEKEQKKYIKQVEQEIKNEFEGELRKLTISQGRILLKLIDREIGETSYALLKEFKSGFSAVFWQTLAKIFGHDLKSTYDPKGEDWLLNQIVLRVENGQL